MDEGLFVRKPALFLRAKGVGDFMFEMEFFCVPEQLEHLLSSWCEVAGAEGLDFFPARAGEFEPLRTRVGDTQSLLAQVRESTSGSLFLKLAGRGVADVSFPETPTDDVEHGDSFATDFVDDEEYEDTLGPDLDLASGPLVAVLRVGLRADLSERHTRAFMETCLRSEAVFGQITAAPPYGFGSATAAEWAASWCPPTVTRSTWMGLPPDGPWTSRRELIWLGKEYVEVLSDTATPPGAVASSPQGVLLDRAACDEPSRGLSLEGLFSPKCFLTVHHDPDDILPNVRQAGWIPQLGFVTGDAAEAHE